ncbi:MAG: hypothetical protein WKG07_06985 [Hymenobacter sp.]
MGEERRLATLLAFAQALERTATDDILDLFDGLMTTLALRGEANAGASGCARSRTWTRPRWSCSRPCASCSTTPCPMPPFASRCSDRIGEDAAAGSGRRGAGPGQQRRRPAAAGAEQAATPRCAVFCRPCWRASSSRAPRRPSPCSMPGTSCRPRSGRPGPAEVGGAPARGGAQSWTRRVFPAKGEVNPPAYTLCVLDRLHQALRRREVFVPTQRALRRPAGRVAAGRGLGGGARLRGPGPGPLHRPGRGAGPAASSSCGGLHRSKRQPGPQHGPASAERRTGSPT